MKKLLFLTAFMLISLCFYAQTDLTVRNTSSYTITVGASEGIDPDCILGSGYILSLAPNATGTIITTNSTYDWTVVRAGIIGIGTPPIEQVVKESSCSFECATDYTDLLDATWNGCYEVTIF
jgi:hypothetical protein